MNQDTENAIVITDSPEIRALRMVISIQILADR